MKNVNIRQEMVAVTETMVDEIRKRKMIGPPVKSKKGEEMNARILNERNQQNSLFLVFNCILPFFASQFLTFLIN